MFIGIGGSLILGSTSFIIGLFFGVGIISALSVLLFTLGFPTIYTLYFLHLKNYKKHGLKEEDMYIGEDNLESKSIKLDFSISTSFKTYKKQIKELEKLYKSKEKTTKEFIEKRFTPPQLTYDKFMATIDSCNTLFYNQAESALNIIDVASEHTAKVDSEIKKRIDTLKAIVIKMDELRNELAINLGDSTDESYSGETKDVLEDMENLVDSVKEYD